MEFDAERCGGSWEGGVQGSTVWFISSFDVYFFRMLGPCLSNIGVIRGCEEGRRIG